VNLAPPEPQSDSVVRNNARKPLRDSNHLDNVVAFVIIHKKSRNKKRFFHYITASREPLPIKEKMTLKFDKNQMENKAAKQMKDSKMT